ncbi:hypothetical protein D3C72_2445940 [compost metagenome]
MLHRHIRPGQFEGADVMAVAACFDDLVAKHVRQHEPVADDGYLLHFSFSC